FATDPFHEGGNTGGMSERSIAACVLKEMLAAKEDAVWMIQSWQSNPASELLAGLSDVENGKDHALILDLYAEKNPHHHEGKAGNPNHGYTPEFDGTPWLYCMLNNFGGRLGLHGHLDNMAKKIPYAYNNCQKITGIGITPEASVNNPVLYDFLFDCIWQENANEPMAEIDLSSWLSDYAERRYGKKSTGAEKAWDIFKETVYKAELNILGQGAPECVFNARPTLEVKTASTWGNAVIAYDKKDLEQATKLLLSDYSELQKSPGYRYDVATALQQILSNQCQDTYHEMVAAYHNKDAEAFEKLSTEFLAYAEKMETVTGSSEYYLLGTWVERAKALAKNADDFTKKLYEMNAKSLITTWGSYNQSEIGKLHDYSNRQWSGLIGDFYKKRWERWIDARLRELKGEPYPEKIDWFAWEWAWVRDNKAYPNTPQETDLSGLAKEILTV
ncbi:MAG: alpha-N-acetylglucosaminidase C-terminal domain-containing protein, partial [Clostridia bacterium]|nr:alpha-N-acetylglucosaminidase C-terminal domain-containing protein [Clostridia bacterium]